MKTKADLVCKAQNIVQQAHGNKKCIKSYSIIESQAQNRKKNT